RARTATRLHSNLVAAFRLTGPLAGHAEREDLQPGCTATWLLPFALQDSLGLRDPGHELPVVVVELRVDDDRALALVQCAGDAVHVTAADRAEEVRLRLDRRRALRVRRQVQEREEAASR